MPTNLPPEAQEAERRYRAASTTEEKIASLEEYLRLIPKHKGTDHLRADLRRKLSSLKSGAQARKKGARQESVYHIDREGAGQVVVIGPPNVGKSALVAALTNAAPEVSDAPYTTWAPTPGMMPVDNVQVQLIDTPPLTQDYVEPQLMDLIRRSDLILAVVDLQTEPLQQLEDTVSILEDNRIVPENGQESPEGERPVVRKRLLVLANKADDEESDELYQVFCELLEECGQAECPSVAVSATTGRNLERLKKLVFDSLGVLRVYSKAPGKEPDYATPFVLKKGSTVEDFAGRVHKDFLENLKAARVWGSSAFDGQMVARDYVLHDGDVVELRI
jgi:ribosome-interacting GTPase 1